MSHSEIRIELVTSDGLWANFRHFIQKTDSQDVSQFQALGLLFLMLDRVTEFDAAMGDYSKLSFKSILMNDGWDESVVRRLLSAAGWQERLYVSWSALTQQEHKAARDLDYSLFQNYWPDLEFCQHDWDAKVLLWSKHCPPEAQRAVHH